MVKSKSWVRGGSLAALVAVPALAVAFLGSNMLAGPILPGLRMSETREFNRLGQNLSTPNKVDADQPVEIFLDNWQNTVREPPSPRL